jgi:hypothetical protein
MFMPESGAKLIGDSYVPATRTSLPRKPDFLIGAVSFRDGHEINRLRRGIAGSTSFAVSWQRKWIALGRA